MYHGLERRLIRFFPLNDSIPGKCFIRSVSVHFVETTRPEDGISDAVLPADGGISSSGDRTSDSGRSELLLSTVREVHACCNCALECGRSDQITLAWSHKG